MKVRKKFVINTKHQNSIIRILIIIRKRMAFHICTKRTLIYHIYSKMTQLKWMACCEGQKLYFLGKMNMLYNMFVVFLLWNTSNWQFYSELYHMHVVVFQQKKLQPMNRYLLVATHSVCTLEASSFIGNSMRNLDCYITFTLVPLVVVDVERNFISIQIARLRIGSTQISNWAAEVTHKLRWRFGLESGLIG